MLSIGFVFIWLVLGMYLKDCNAREVEECLGIRNTCEINDLSLELFHSGMVAGSVSIKPYENLNDTTFIIMSFGDKDLDSMNTRTIYGINSDFINPQGLPLRKNVDSKLVIHKDFTGQWATEKDKIFYDTVQSGGSITVYFSIIDLVEDTSPNFESYRSKTLACAMFTLIKP